MKPILEKIDFPENSSLLAFQYDQEVFDAPWHFHPEFELTYIQESSGTRYVGNTITSFSPGDLVLLGSNLPHCWINDTSPSGRSRSIVIQWSPDLIKEILIFEAITSLLLKSQRGLCIKSEHNAQVSGRMLEMLDTTALRQYTLLVELLDFIERNTRYEPIAGPSYSYDHTTTTTTRLELVQSYVKDHFNEKIRLADLAHHLHMNEQSFSRFFSKTMNKTFFEFLNEYRVNRASRFILDTDRQMAEIAYQCGYESLPFFYKQFKKFKGFTPLEFRKMYRRIK